jgi:hypothetical protein
MPPFNNRTIENKQMQKESCRCLWFFFGICDFFLLCGLAQFSIGGIGGLKGQRTDIIKVPSFSVIADSLSLNNRSNMRESLSSLKFDLIALTAHSRLSTQQQEILDSGHSPHNTLLLLEQITELTIFWGEREG